MFSQKQIKMGINDNIETFDFNSMSDGERAAFFYIATTIIAPEKSFIIVDEPERHLNPAIYNIIWDRLIQERSDCQFIFISHNMDFINGRTNFELVKIKKIIHPYDFDFEFFGDSIEDINKNFLLEIIGSQKPILFCEGKKETNCEEKENTSLDSIIYKILFGDKYTIIPIDNCNSVIKHVNICNQLYLKYTTQRAKGIIDCDMRIQDEINELSSKSIYTTQYYEIELILLDDNIFKSVLHSEKKDENLFIKFKNLFLNYLENNKEDITYRYAKKILEYKLHNIVIGNTISNISKKNLADEYEKNCKSINTDVWENAYKNISKDIEEKNYNECLKYYSLKHEGPINKFVENEIDTQNYTDTAINVLKNDIKLVKTVREKFFKYL